MQLLRHAFLHPTNCLLYSVRTNANRTSICRIKRKIYPRMYPVIVAFADGGSVRIRFHEPRHLLQLPLDLNDCSAEEKQRRLLRRSPRTRLVLHEELEDTFDSSAYDFLLK
ncbi:unnamed protein product [Dicrocoelium dendriticum]|nr:unnamed protein product [Dicrocoelium dendriticum]